MAEDPAFSNIMGGILMLAVTILLAALLALVLMYLPVFLYNEEVPTVFEITNIRDKNENGKLNYDSYMVLTNIGDKGYDNRKLYARTYRLSLIHI